MRIYTIYSFREAIRPFKDKNGVSHERYFKIIHPDHQTACQIMINKENCQVTSLNDLAVLYLFRFLTSYAPVTAGFARFGILIKGSVPVELCPVLAELCAALLLEHLDVSVLLLLDLL